MEAQVSLLQKQLLAEQNKRLDEGLRSLTEGKAIDLLPYVRDDHLVCD